MKTALCLLRIFCKFIFWQSDNGIFPGTTVNGSIYFWFWYSTSMFMEPIGWTILPIMVFSFKWLGFVEQFSKVVLNVCSLMMVIDAPVSISLGTMLPSIFNDLTNGCTSLSWSRAYCRPLLGVTITPNLVP